MSRMEVTVPVADDEATPTPGPVVDVVDVVEPVTPADDTPAEASDDVPVEPESVEDPRTVKELRAALKAVGLSSKGSKAELIARLDDPAAPPHAPPTEAPSPVADAVDPEPSKSAGSVVVVATLFMWRDTDGNKKRSRKGDVLTGVPAVFLERGLRNGTLASA